VLFPDPVRPLLVISKISMCALLTVEVGKRTDSLREYNPSALLLERADVARVQYQILKQLVIKYVRLSSVKRRLNQRIELRVD
jgi:hypothetical protein